MENFVEGITCAEMVKVILVSFVLLILCVLVMDVRMEKVLASLHLSALVWMMTIVQWRTHVESQVYKFKICKNEKRNISATCESNSDCEASPIRPVCKETVPGGTKICQNTGASSKECLPKQFSDAEDNCVENINSSEMEIDKGDWLIN